MTSIISTRILIAVATEGDAQDIDQQLQKMGYESVGYTTQSAAVVHQVAHLRPDLILMDEAIYQDLNDSFGVQALGDNGVPAVLLSRLRRETYPPVRVPFHPVGLHGYEFQNIVAVVAGV